MNLTGASLDLSGRAILVTGGTGYLGRAICIGLAERGAHVLVNARNAQKADDLIMQIHAIGGSAETAITGTSGATQNDWCRTNNQ